MREGERKPGDRPRGRMRRLALAWYQGYAFVLWNMTMRQRKTGWLSEGLHARFREIQLHTLGRYHLISLGYCLMPDHLHMLWAGLALESDQNRAAAFFRRQFDAVLPAGVELQKQGWDSVLREKDRERGAVISAAFYIAQNPVRANLVADAVRWPFSGAQAMGYPVLDWRQPDFAEKVWRIYELEGERLRGRQAGTLTRLRGDGSGEKAGTLTRSAPVDEAQTVSGSGAGDGSGEETGTLTRSAPGKLGDRSSGAEPVTAPAKEDRNADAFRSGEVGSG
jgi:putative transposase